jgi:hypothetical protein
MEDSGGANLFPEDFLKSSSLYVRHLAQKEEVAKHKWYESEKVGKDVGDDYAFFDWLLKHSSSWRASQQK